jgi:hypothetical protein
MKDLPRPAQSQGRSMLRRSRVQFSPWRAGCTCSVHPPICRLGLAPRRMKHGRGARGTWPTVRENLYTLTCVTPGRLSDEIGASTMNLVGPAAVSVKVVAAFAPSQAAIASLSDTAPRSLGFRGPRRTAPTRGSSRPRRRSSSWGAPADVVGAALGRSGRPRGGEQDRVRGGHGAGAARLG